MYGFSSGGYGVFGDSSSGYGVFGESSSSIGAYGYSGSSYGVYAATNWAARRCTPPIQAAATGSAGSATAGLGSTVTVPLLAPGPVHDGLWYRRRGFRLRIGVYGSSGSGWAGYFNGNVSATSYSTSSDRNAKTNIQSVDSKDILERVSRLPITSWDFKTDPTKRHLGPMAQDFHAAFGLNGDDDTHIALNDLAGVSLAAIQELSHEMKRKDAKIADLNAHVEQLEAQLRDVQQLKQQVAQLRQIVSTERVAMRN